MLAAFEREEPGPTWAHFFRAVLECTNRLGDLRVLLRELRAMTGAMSPEGRRGRQRALRQRFGPDRDEGRELVTVEKVRARGRIRSEREYRSVEAYADSIAGERARHDEYLALGALLNAFTAAP